MNGFPDAPRKPAGFSMIEVLVTLIVLLVGLLGLAALHIQAQRSEMESYQRIQALILLQDMADRISANRKVTSYQNVEVGTSPTTPVTCPGGTIAEQDICQWHNALLGAAEVTGGTNVGAMIKAHGCVGYDATTETENNTGKLVPYYLDGASHNAADGARYPNTGTYTVSVAWQGLGDTAEPSDACGSGIDYGGAAKRRVVSLTLRFACLTCQHKP